MNKLTHAYLETFLACHLSNVKKLITQFCILFDILSEYTVAPKLTKVPRQFLIIKEGTIAAISCEAFSYPPSVITWTRALAGLPKGRSAVFNGTLRIRDFSVEDTGSYLCTAENKVGKDTASVVLGIQRKPGKL